ncbi:MAG: hypothetical protein ACKPEQ_03625, partial [Dolichospermum sp.]
MIILDEPTAPLPKHDVVKLFEFVRRQRERGASFIYISHYLEEIFEVADHVTVMRNGTVAGFSPVKDITQPELIRLISGADVERYKREGSSIGGAVLEVKGLTRPGAYSDVNLMFHGVVRWAYSYNPHKQSLWFIMHANGASKQRSLNNIYVYEQMHERAKYKQCFSG